MYQNKKYWWLWNYSLYFIIDKVDRDIEEKNIRKKNYLPLVSDDKKNLKIKKYTELWNKIKDLIEKIGDN